MTCRFDWRTVRLDTGTFRLRAIDHSEDCSSLSWSRVVDAWSNDAEFCHGFSGALAKIPFGAFRWETPAMRSADLGSPFECVVVDSPDLPRRADPEPFAEHFADAGGRPVVTFGNLGGDAQLVVPCPRVADSAYTHLADFVRAAPTGQKQALWREVGLEMRRRLGEKPIWLSTAGGGVAWFHVRFDNRPKYYAHRPYRRIPGT